MKIRARALTKIPATLQASGGLKVDKQNGRWTFSPNWDVLTLETTLPDAAGRQLWTLNPNTGVYTRLSVQALIDNMPPGPPGPQGPQGPQGELTSADIGVTIQGYSTARRQGKASIWINADEFVPRITNGARIGVVERGTNKNPYVYLAFDPVTSEYAHTKLRFPNTWNNGKITATPYWSHPATTTNFGVAWGVSVAAISDDDTSDATLGAAYISADVGGTTDDLYIAPETLDINIAGSPASGDLIDICIARYPSNGNDTMAVDAHLIGVRIVYTENAANED